MTPRRLEAVLKEQLRQCPAVALLGPRQVGKATLAGRIAYLELGPLDVLEVEPENEQMLWARRGFPRSFLARSDAQSATWRENFITTYLERDIPQLGPRIPAKTLRRFWTMLAHNQGCLLC